MTGSGDSAEVRALHIRVGGRVQGVGFRYFVQRTARSHGLVGWVRNLPDGDVELHAEGPGASLERLVSDVREGPPVSRVDRLDRRDAEPRGSFREFEITY